MDATSYKERNKMSKWIDFSLDERKAMIQGVVEARQIDEAAAGKDWWVTAVLYSLFHSSVSEYLLFKVVRVSVKAGISSTDSVKILI